MSANSNNFSTYAGLAHKRTLWRNAWWWARPLRSARLTLSSLVAVIKMLLLLLLLLLVLSGSGFLLRLCTVLWTCLAGNTKAGAPQRGHTSAGASGEVPSSLHLVQEFPVPLRMYILFIEVS